MVNRAGNASGLVGDGGSTTYVEITPTPGPGTVAGVQTRGIAGPKEEISPSPTEAGQLGGGQAVEESPAAGKILGKTVGKIGGNKTIWILGILVIIAIAIYFLLLKKKK